MTPAYVSVKTASDLLDGISERVIREANGDALEDLIRGPA